MMQKYLYFCPKCHFIGSAGHQDPNEYQQCADCKSSMIYAGFTKEDWDAKTREEKDKIKDHLKKEADSHKNIEIDSDATVRILSMIQRDMSVIKNIIVGWAVITILGGLILILM